MSKRVFLSHSSKDAEFARVLCERLEGIGIDCWIAPRDIPSGEYFGQAITDGLLKDVRVMVVVVSRESLGSPHVLREVHWASEGRLQYVPVKIEDVKIEGPLAFYLGPVQWLDAFQVPRDSHMEKLIETVALRLGHTISNMPRIRTDEPRRIALLYKRGVQPDDAVLALLETGLAARGYKVFIDRHLTIGMEWATQIQQRICEADAVIPLLSEKSIESEMLCYEVQVARAAREKDPTKARLLPVRVRFEGALPQDFAIALDRLQYFLWSGPEDGERLIEHVDRALNARNDKTHPAPDIDPPGGAMKVDSKFYVVRTCDQELQAGIERRDSILLIKGARQMGKTSLLARGLQQARRGGLKVAFTDFQKFSSADLASQRTFYVALAQLLADRLDIDASPDAEWDEHRGPNGNFERFIQKRILAGLSSHLVWGMDEVDRLFTQPYAGDVFGLFRTWHNERALEPDGPWSRLTLAIAYATEAHLFITDPNQSPFNVGTRLALQDFALDQVGDLNARHGSPLQPSEVAHFQRLVGGHPFLVRRGLYELATRRMSLADFESHAARDDGPYGDHLRRLLVMLAREPGLIPIVRGVLDHGTCPTSGDFYRLSSAGYIVGASQHEARMRCEIYDKYLRGHLS